MKNFFLILLGILSLNFILTGCSSDEDTLQESISECNTRSVNSMENEFTSEQTKILAHLDSINEKYADESGTLTPQLVSFSWNRVVRDDAQGAIDGFRFGWSRGSGFLGRVVTASLTSVAYCIGYSIKSIYTQLHDMGIFSRATTASDDYTLYEIQKAMALVWDSPEVDEKVNEIKTAHPDITLQYNDEELRLAVIHNIALQTLHKDEIIPNGVLDKLFSTSQQQFFNSIYVRNYYDGIPSIIEGKTTVVAYGGSLNFPFATAVFDKYSNGIMRLSTSDLNQFENNLYNLCNDYIAEIGDNSQIEYDARQPLITSLYIAPLSCEYWRSRYVE